MTYPFWNSDEERRHRRRNRLHSLTLLGGMTALLALCGWVLGGDAGLLWLSALGGLSLLLTPRLPPGLVLRSYRARPVLPGQWPQVYDVLAGLAQRAGLERVPVLHVLPSRQANAFAVGDAGQAAIAVTEGLLARLSLRELAAVLAHEIAHIRHDDSRLLALADLMTRLTRSIAVVGAIVLVLSLPALIDGQADLSWPLALVLMAAPTISALMQLALSRTREFDADLAAARLTGDPAGLIAALQRMDEDSAGWWATLLGRRGPDRQPSLLRTHPSTAERLKRLAALHVAAAAPIAADMIIWPFGAHRRRMW